MVVKFGISATGHKCNTFPELTILQNDKIVYSGFVENKSQILIDLDLANSDIITIKGIGKSFGQNNIWDTKIDEFNNIVEDKILVIHDISFDGISMGTEWLKNLDAVVDNQQVKFSNTSFYFNGHINLTVNLPLLDWIIDQKYIKPAKQLNTGKEKLGSGANKFIYTDVTKYITKIKALLNDENTSM